MAPLQHLYKTFTTLCSREKPARSLLPCVQCHTFHTQPAKQACGLGQHKIELVREQLIASAHTYLGLLSLSRVRLNEYRMTLDEALYFEHARGCTDTFILLRTQLALHATHTCPPNAQVVVVYYSFVHGTFSCMQT